MKRIISCVMFGAVAMAAAYGQEQADTVAVEQKTMEVAYAKSDFVSGDVLVFEDTVEGEQLGEFPSKWDLSEGTAEVISLGGETVIYLSGGGVITPLMEDMRSYLGNVFTIELDFWVNDQQEKTQSYDLYFYDEEDNQVLDYNIWDTGYRWSYTAGNGDYRYGEVEYMPYKKNAWNHFALSFNKRAMKAYLNGERYTNVPNMKSPRSLKISVGDFGNHFCCIKNVRIAEGAVPLYDRMMTDGKFISYGITFDTGRATIKPESMAELTRIVQLMNENPSLRFSVEGHTDSTGNAASNQHLSEQRSAAVVAKLGEMGIGAERLAASGKGQNSPVADNSTSEGRARNRRVEFVVVK